MKKRIKARLVVTVLMLIMFVAAAILLNWSEEGREERAARKRMFAVAEVVDIIADNGEEDSWTEGRRIGRQTLEVRIISGPEKGAVLEAENYMNAYYNVDARLGKRVIVKLDYNDRGELYVASIPNYDRSPVLIGVIVVFAVLMILIGGKKGARALLGLVFTVVSLWYLLIPMVLRGVPSILSAIVITAIASAGAIVLLNGFTKKTLCALLGCMGGLAAAGIFSGFVAWVTPINGFNMPEAEEMVLRANEYSLKISGLLISGILLSAMGALMDTSMSIVSALHEVYEQNPTISAKQIFKSGMNIGRDAMGTMANTLILAFVGSAFNLLILFRLYDYPMIQVLNSDMIVIEVLQGIAGSIGIIMTTPLASWLCAVIFPAHLSKKK